MNRREISSSLLSAVATYTLLQTFAQRQAFAGSSKPIAARWIRTLHDFSADLRTATITPGQWQTKVNELFDRVSLEDLLARIDFEKLAVGFPFEDLGVHTKEVKFPAFAGLPERLAFNGKIFGMKKDRAIIPHGHRNMVSCHFVLKGGVHLRQYDRVADDATHMVIEPTVDQPVGVGNHSSISDEKNNVHWLIASSDNTFTFDVLVADLGGKDYEIDNIDPDDAEKISGGQLRARKLSVEEALRKYGNESHHSSVAA